ncbi:MAG: 2-oxo acid dehydrogenase subunit E2 [Cyanobacteria bacterium SZAS LIN-3]|nr:2-oxo acid dehydrogenase subunit E2 [Cyanobacteria bacterium SZAS LIN-3]
MTRTFSAPAACEVATIERARWNVLDLLCWISRKAVTAQLLCDIETERVENLAQILSSEKEKITVTAILLKAIAIAQLKYPDSRSYRLPWGHKVVRKVPVAGFTVERMVDGKPAVFFAAIRDAHSKSLEQIAHEISAYGNNEITSVTQLTKEHLISMVPWILRQFYIAIGLNVTMLREIVNPATFGLTSLGKFGLKAPLAPNVTTTIFGIGTMEPTPVVREGKVVVRNMMQIALAVDLRNFGLYEAAYLLKDVKAILESGLAGYLTDEERAIVEADKEQQTVSTEDLIQRARKLVDAA